VGNDFLPHLPTLDIGEHAFDVIFTAYKELMTKSEGYIVQSGEIGDMPRLVRVRVRVRVLFSYSLLLTPYVIIIILIIIFIIVIIDLIALIINFIIRLEQLFELIGVQEMDILANREEEAKEFATKRRLDVKVRVRVILSGTEVQ
jgi:hypothetical protein